MLCVRRWSEDDAVLMVFHFGTAQASVTLPVPAGRWHKRLDSADQAWHSPGSALPPLLIGDEDVNLPLSPQAVVLFTWKDA
jgi:hypothetical protein